MATPKQQKLIKLLIENYGATDSTKSLGEMLLEAGYSEASAHNPKLIIEGKEVQEGLSDVVDDLNLLRQNALNELKARDLSEERFPDVVKAIDTFTKNAQLLSGGATKRQEIGVLSEERKEELLSLLTRDE